jgi:hypothetical protein
MLASRKKLHQSIYRGNSPNSPNSPKITKKEIINTKMSLMNAHITLLTHTRTQQEIIDIIDIMGVVQSYYMKKYTLIHFEIQKKLIVVGLFLF